VAQTPTKHVDAVARTEVIKQQVVLGRADLEGADPFRDLTEKDILAKAHMAMELMAADGMDEAKNVRFLHVWKTA